MSHPTGPRRRSTNYRAGIGAAALAGTLAALPSPAAAAPVNALDGDHCVLRVIDQDATGELHTAPPVCFGTLAEALEYAGGAPLGRDDASSSELAAAAATVLGVHFEHQDRTGASITISGDTCSGGWVNLAAAWTNRISSTRNGCASVRFFDGFSQSGTSELTNGTTVNLKALNDAANSVQYG